MKRFMGIILSAVMAAGLLSACGNSSGNAEDTANSEEQIIVSEEETPVASPKVTVEGTKFMVDGKELYINGVNTPWEKWNEFGSNFDPTFWEQHFADLHDIGVNAVRVWLNCDSMISIKLKEDGTVREVIEKHWQDVDKLFEIAEANQIYLMPTLLSFDHFKSNNCEKWRLTVTDDTAMQSYIDNYIKPFTERYGDDPYLLGIDLMNEPDWVIENEECGKLPIESLSKYFAKCTAAVHETNPETLVTVGVAMIKYNSDDPKYMGNFVSDEKMKEYGGENACLDFYSTHYYDWMRSYMGCPYDMSPTDFGLDGTKPAFLGETSAEGGETLPGLYEKCYNNGWNGVMLWTSNNGAEHADNWEDIAAATTKIESLAPEKVFPLGKAE